MDLVSLLPALSALLPEYFLEILDENFKTCILASSSFNCRYSSAGGFMLFPNTLRIVIGLESCGGFGRTIGGIGGNGISSTSFIVSFFLFFRHVITSTAVIIPNIKQAAKDDSEAIRIVLSSPGSETLLESLSKNAISGQIKIQI